MLQINKITSHEAVDYAAHELKKYLRMMNPAGNDITISYAPNAECGFRLGLMQDFDLDVSDVKDTRFDDILYIDADGNGGIIAGDNPRSVLLSVYEFLRQNGCRWLFPGTDGEYIPQKKLASVKYRYKPSMRYRGSCIEGACTQQMLLDTIEFIPKIGMNLFQMQFLIPTVFYGRYYEHRNNAKRAAEPLSNDAVLQWKTACETEIAKRGLQFHDVGHGWTVAPFGVDPTAGWDKIDESKISEDARQYLAQLDGKRRLFGGVPLNTQFCMSSPVARKKAAEAIADYAQNHLNVEYLHVWLGDGYNNHCECEGCVKKGVSDWYITFLNDIDALFTERGLDTKIVFCSYTETTWAPKSEKLVNPDRFALMLCPISRSYTETLTDKEIELKPYVRNHIAMPPTLDEYMSHIKEWKRVYDGAYLCYEYHFWKHQLFEPSGLLLAKRINEDIEAYEANGFNGLIACGSQRSTFPTGFAFYLFARKLYDTSLTYEELLTEYFICAFGEDYVKFIDYLYDIAECFGDKYLEGEESIDETVSLYYNPKRAKKLSRVKEVVEGGKRLILEHYNSVDRIKTASVRILEMHALYCTMLAAAAAYKALGDEKNASLAFDEFQDYLNKTEIYTEKYLDHYLASFQLEWSIKGNRKKTDI